MGGDAVPIERVQVSAYEIPTDGPESDGTFTWDATILVLVEVYGGGKQGIGYSYTAAATARLIDDVLAPVVKGRDALSVDGSWAAMLHEIRNLGRPGIAASAISAVDVALWDLKARLLDLPMVDVLGQVHDCVPVYGSGGFTNYTDERLQEQFEGWVDEGIRMVKMKVGTYPDQDRARVEAARDAIGDDVDLFVDANGGYDRKQALWFAETYADYGVVWFEEPVSSDDLGGLRLMRDRAPSGMDITAGEYGYDLFYFRRMLEAGAVDVLQADATRCLGYSGFLRAGTLCEAHALPLSAHTAPNLHVHAACAALPIRNVEYFYDHVRIEHMLFDGALDPVGGCLRPDRTRAGLGLSFKHADAEPYRIYGSSQS
ncbi:MAG TPA: enolase C-terminal domain-like protein [Rhodothermales bacterium]|nr:enolase C-terminal domain-like protein [Rhodothermales bacterium]